MSKCYVVNENDEVLGVKDFHDCGPEDIQRVSALWLTNSNDGVLIAQRAFTKKYSPAASGTVEEGEDYLSNIIKETKEEIGVTLTEDELTLGPKMLREDKHRYFTQWYMATKDVDISDIVYPQDEVVTVEWIAIKTLQKEITEKMRLFTGSMKKLAFQNMATS